MARAAAGRGDRDANAARADAETGPRSVPRRGAAGRGRGWPIGGGRRTRRALARRGALGIALRAPRGRGDDQPAPRRARRRRPPARPTTPAAAAELPRGDPCAARCGSGGAKRRATSADSCRGAGGRWSASSITGAAVAARAADAVLLGERFGEQRCPRARSIARFASAGRRRRDRRDDDRWEGGGGVGAGRRRSSAVQRRPRSRARQRRRAALRDDGGGVVGRLPRGGDRREAAMGFLAGSTRVVVTIVSSVSSSSSSPPTSPMSGTPSACASAIIWARALGDACRVGPSSDERVVCGRMGGDLRRRADACRAGDRPGERLAPTGSARFGGLSAGIPAAGRTASDASARRGRPAPPSCTYRASSRLRDRAAAVGSGSLRC